MRPLQQYDQNSLWANASVKSFSLGSKPDVILDPGGWILPDFAPPEYLRVILFVEALLYASTLQIWEKVIQSFKKRLKERLYGLALGPLFWPLSASEFQLNIGVLASMRFIVDDGVAFAVNDANHHELHTRFRDAVNEAVFILGRTQHFIVETSLNPFDVTLEIFGAALKEILNHSTLDLTSASRHEEVLLRILNELPLYGVSVSWRFRRR